MVDQANRGKTKGAQALSNSLSFESISSNLSSGVQSDEKEIQPKHYKSKKVAQHQAPTTRLNLQGPLKINDNERKVTHIQKLMSEKKVSERVTKVKVENAKKIKHFLHKQLDFEAKRLEK